MTNMDITDVFLKMVGSLITDKPGGNMNNKLRKLLDVTLTEQQEREEARNVKYCDICNTELIDIEDKLCDDCTLKEQQLERDIDDELMEEQ